MPNWVRNHLTIHGDKAVEVMKSLLTEVEDGEKEFDFEKIKPMPSELNLIAGRVTQNSARLYINSLKEYGEEYIKYAKIYKQAFNGGNVMLLDEERQVLMKEAMSQHDIEAEDHPLLFNSPNDVLDYGKRALDNYAQYESVDWYKWRLDNWGTKWNASGTEIPVEDVAELYFDTAWNPVTDLMCELSRQNSECQFDYEYAEEEASVITGKFEIEKGKATGEKYENYSKAAYETYFRLWGGDDEFTFNKRKNTYERIESESEMD